MVFVDGQRRLHTALVKALGCWRSWQVILDWYHLEKRCRENLSLALKGRLIRKQVYWRCCGMSASVAHWNI